MRCMVVYDIADDRKRSRVADVCQDYGLDRMQYSAFTGNLASPHQAELWKQLKNTMGKSKGNILLLGVCDTDWEARKHLDNRSPAEERNEKVNIIPSLAVEAGSGKREEGGGSGT